MTTSAYQDDNCYIQPQQQEYLEPFDDPLNIAVQLGGFVSGDTRFEVTEKEGLCERAVKSPKCAYPQ